jgi:hypothetical protein
MDFSHGHNLRSYILPATRGLRVRLVILLVSCASFHFGEWARAEVVAPARTQSRQQSQSKSANTSSSAPGTSSAPAAKEGGVAATVVTDGALVYARPNFDANVITTLPEGRRLRVSRTTSGRMAKFHRVRLGGRTGFIVDIDLAIEGAKPPPRSQRPNQTQADKKSPGQKPSGNKPSGKKQKAAKERDPRELPIYFSRFVGALGGALSFKEDVSGREVSAALPIYGLKITGPDVVFDGPVLDIGLALHYGAPEYYESLSSIKPAGFVLLTDALILLPIFQAHNAMVSFGFGPLVTYSSFRILRSDRLEELTRFGMGASLSLGAAFRYENMAIRLEGKHLLESKSHQAIQASIQTGF